jgi:hypothetical protein
MNLGGAEVFLLTALWIGAWIFGIWLVLRFVRAVERIADAQESMARSGRRDAPEEESPGI